MRQLKKLGTIFLLVFAAANAQGGSCPGSHRFVYRNGDWCCSTNKEKVYAPEGGSCDGSIIDKESTCCLDDVFIACPNKPCVDFQITCSKPSDLASSLTLTPASARIPVGGQYTVTCPEHHTPPTQQLVCEESGDPSQEAGRLVPAKPGVCVLEEPQPVEKAKDNDSESDDNSAIIIAGVAIPVGVIGIVASFVVFKFKDSICPRRSREEQDVIPVIHTTNEVKVTSDTENNLEMTGKRVINQFKTSDLANTDPQSLVLSLFQDKM